MDEATIYADSAGVFPEPTGVGEHEVALAVDADEAAVKYALISQADPKFPLQELRYTRHVRGGGGGGGEGGGGGI